jgi:CHASE1-domain containing sensor protein
VNMRSKFWMTLALCSATACHASTTDQSIELADVGVAVLKGAGVVTPPLTQLDRQYANRASTVVSHSMNVLAADKSVQRPNTARLMLFGLGLVCVVAVRKNRKY